MQRYLTLQQLGGLIAKHHKVINYTIRRVKGYDSFLEFKDNKEEVVYLFSLAPVEDRAYYEELLYPRSILLEGFKGRRICCLYSVRLKEGGSKFYV